MQTTDKTKQNVNQLEQYYRPVGFKAVLAAALMLKAGKPVSSPQPVKSPV